MEDWGGEEGVGGEGEEEDGVGWVVGRGDLGLDGVGLCEDDM